MELFKASREESIQAADWRSQQVQYIEAWKYKNVDEPTVQTFRHGSLKDAEIKDWLQNEGDYSIPIPSESAGDLEGGFRILFCERHSHQRIFLGTSRESFELIETAFELHPATLSAVTIDGGTYSKHIQYNSEEKLDKISIILKAPQKLEIANYMLSLTHSTNTRWTNAILVGEHITDHSAVESGFIPKDIPFQVIVRSLRDLVLLWNHPLLLPSLVLKDHLARTRLFCNGPLTRQVMFIEDQLGATRVGRRQEQGPASTRRHLPVYRLAEERFNKGEPVEKSQALSLTVGINTQFTKVLFTKRSPKWNHDASQFILQLIQEFSTEPQSKLQGHKLSELLQYNIPIATAAEDHTTGLQKRLELQLDILYSFVAQTDNRLSARLAATAGRDSTSMKILAFITTLYLPGTFVATLFSMSMFDWQNNGSSDSRSSTVSNHFWIYWAVMAPLTALTFLGFGMWWRVELKRFDINVKHEEKFSVDNMIGL